MAHKMRPSLPPLSNLCLQPEERSPGPPERNVLSGRTSRLQNRDISSCLGLVASSIHVPWGQLLSWMEFCVLPISMRADAHLYWKGVEAYLWHQCIRLHSLECHQLGPFCSTLCWDILKWMTQDSHWNALGFFEWPSEYIEKNAL